MCSDINMEARIAKRGQISNRCLRAKQDDEISVARNRVARTKTNEIDRRLRLQRVEIVEVGHMGKDWDSNLDPRVRFLDAGSTLECHCVFRRKQSSTGKEGYDRSEERRVGKESRSGGTE